MSGAPIERYDGIILAGGSSRRMGSDKLSETVGGTTLFARAVCALSAADTVVVVGPRRDVDRSVVWALEEPAGSGPAMAIKAGIAALPDSTAAHIILLAGDIPFAEDVVASLLNPVTMDRPAAVVDEDHQIQFLMSAWSRPLLEARCAAVAPADRVSSLFDGLAVTPVTLATKILDCDTPEDLAAARLEALQRGPSR